MAKYRVVKHGDHYYPQYRKFWCWHEYASSSTEGTIWFYTKDDAIKFINEDKRPAPKPEPEPTPVPEVVWTL